MSEHGLSQDGSSWASGSSIGKGHSSHAEASGQVGRASGRVNPLEPLCVALGGPAGRSAAANAQQAASDPGLSPLGHSAEFHTSVHNKKQVGTKYDPAKSGAVDIPAELDRQEVGRAAQAGKLSELEARRLVLLHACRNATVRQLQFMRAMIEQPAETSVDRAALVRVCQQLEQCASQLVFQVNEEHDFARLQSGHFCKRDRLCSFCARLRAARLVRNYAQRCEVVFERESSKLKPVHVVFTVRNGPDLVERFNQLFSLLELMMQRRRNFGKVKTAKRSPICSALGGVASCEIKRGSGSGQWHPHLHCIWIVPAHVEAADLQAQLRSEWRELSQGDSCNVKCDDVHAFKQGEPFTIEQLRTSFVEVFKYATKGREMNEADSFTAWSKLAGRRLIRSFGWLYGVPEPDELGDQIDQVDFELIDRVYRAEPQGYVLSQEVRS